MKHKLSILALILLVTCSATLLDAKPENKVLRQSTGVYDIQQNTTGNFSFYTSNFGTNFLNNSLNVGSGIWPRGSSNLYIFGGGLWFGCEKVSPSNGELMKFVELTYSPNTGLSWFVPGMVADGDTIVPGSDKKYRVYFSTDFNQSGIPLDQNDGPNWCLWRTSQNGQYHHDTEMYDYVGDVAKRNSTYYSNGPLFVSDEDIVSVFKDTDLKRFEGGVAFRAAKGYPLGLEIQSNIYTWNAEDMKDIIVISYNITNTSDDTLRNCYIGNVFDTDITTLPNTTFGAGNDRAKFYGTDTTLNLVVTWTDTDRGELGKGFGYLGCYLLETPAIDQNGFLRTDKLIYETSEQIGATSYRNWSIQNDVQTDDERYNLLSSSLKEGETGSGDKRLMLSTGGFHLRPGESTRITLAIAAALPAKGGEADGTEEDIAGVTGKSKISNGGVLSSEASLINKVEYSINKYYTGLFSSVKEQVVRSNSIRLSPNPALNSIKLESSLKGRIEVYSIRGERIISQEYADELNISSLPVGLYVLKIGDMSSLFVKE